MLEVEQVALLKTNLIYYNISNRNGFGIELLKKTTILQK